MRIAIYDPYLNTLGGGEKIVACLAEVLEQEYPMALINLLTHDSCSVGVDALSERFGVSLSRTRVRPFELPARPLLQESSFLRRCLDDRLIGRLSADYDLFINLTIFSSAPCRARRGIYWCMFPHSPHGVGETRHTLKSRCMSYVRKWYFRHNFKTYSDIVAISKFTQQWTADYFNLESRVIYPPVELSLQAPSTASKRNIILSVGRFFAGNHNKKHRPMIETFIAMYDRGWKDWEYHLVGSVTFSPGSRQYVEELVELAQGYPIHFHFDADAPTLDALYESASIFWHATGYGEDAHESPEKMEHFGITTVEAMNKALVPIVIAQGGQPEIITPSENGFLWSSLEELAEKTLALAADPERRSALGHHAQRRSQAFSRDVFKEQVRQLVTGAQSPPCV